MPPRFLPDCGWERRRQKFFTVNRQDVSSLEKLITDALHPSRSWPPLESTHTSTTPRFQLEIEETDPEWQVARDPCGNSGFGSVPWIETAWIASARPRDAVE
jgi:hypothetical protein